MKSTRIFLDRGLLRVASAFSTARLPESPYKSLPAAECKEPDLRLER